MHIADAVALQAKNDLVTAYTTLANATPCAALPASIGTMTLTPGVYCFTSDALFTIPSTGLTLDLQGDPNSLFIFQVQGQLTTQTGYQIGFINGTAPCNVWWQIGSSATLGTGTGFIGNIIALTSISLANGTTISPGRALARNGAVTLDTNTINMNGCLAQPPTSTPSNTPTNTPTPSPTPIPPTNTPTSTPSLPISVTSLPLTGESPDNRLPLVVTTGVILLMVAGGLWIFKRVRVQ
jgi:type VI secretion system secreted protein VgrG